MSLAKTKPIGFLFVCTGNICRSPTAEAVFRHQAKAAGVEDRFRIDSAGTHGYHIGDPPDHRTIATALAKGIDMRDLRARKVCQQDFTEFDHILAMDSGHFSHLSTFEGADARLAMYLNECAYKDLPDPYYGSQRDFDLALELVEGQTARLLRDLRQKYNI